MTDVHPITTNGCDRNRWGINVEVLFETWFTKVFLPMFHARFDEHARRETGRDAEISIVVLDPAETHDWRSPLEHIAHLLASTDDHERVFGAIGILANITGKLAFSLRTKLNSLLAETRLDLLLPGDFPHQGAGFYHGYCGGASGLPKGSDDWWCFKKAVDELIRLRAAAAKQAVADSKNRQPGLKYLGTNHFVAMLDRLRRH